MQVHVSSITQFSHLIGTATSVVRNYTKSLFPPNFFKHENLASNIQSVAEKITLTDNMKQIKKRNPSLGIVVEYNPVETVRNDSNIPNNFYNIMNSPFQMNGSSGQVDHLESIFNSDYKEDIRFEYKRVTLNFQVAIRVGTQMEAWNVGEYITNKLRANRNLFIPFDTPVIVPDQLIAIVAKENDLDFYTQKDEILALLKTYAKYHFEKIKYGSKDKFIFQLPMNYQMNINSVPSISKNLKKKSQQNSMVTFALELIFSYPSNFVLTSETADSTDLNMDENIINDEGSQLNIVSPVINFAPREFIDKRRLMSYVKFSPEANKFYELIDFKDIFTTEQQSIIDNLDDMSAVKLYFYLEGYRLADTEFDVDWNNYQILLEQPISNKMYVLAVYIDNTYLI